MPPSPRAWWLLPVLAASALLAAAAALAVGSVAIPPGEVLARCWSALRGDPWGGPNDRILLSARLPRIVMAASVGAGLSLAGLAAQVLFRNPLASPYVVGVSSGSAVGAVAGMMLIGAVPGTTCAVVPGFGVVTGLGVAGTVFLMARRRRDFGHALLLAGIAVAALCSSLTAGALYLAGERLQTLVFWLMGGFWRATWRDTLTVLPTAAAALVVLMLLAPR